MKAYWLKIGAVFIVAAFLSTLTGHVKPAFAQKTADFYKGKTLEVIVCASPGGGYDTWVRMMAPYMKKYTGVSKVIVRNIPGAGGAVGWNYMFGVARPDGLTIAVYSGMSLVLDELLGEAAVKYQFSKFEWLGRITADAGTFAVAKNSPYKTLEDVKKASLFKFGTTGRTNMFGVMPVAIGLAVGANNFKVVAGYKGGAEVQLATIRGEVDALCSSFPSIKHLVDAGDLVMKGIVSHERIKELPKVPTLFELVPNIPADTKKWIDRIITANELHRIALTSPGVPRDRVEFLAQAVKNSLHDPEFVSKGAKMAMDVDYLTPAQQKKQIELLTLTTEERKYLKYLIFEKY